MNSRPLYDVFFELECVLSERFNKDPFYIRKQKFKEVLLLRRRLIKHDEYKSNKKNRRIRKRAGDNWF